MNEPAAEHTPATHAAPASPETAAPTTAVPSARGVEVSARAAPPLHVLSLAGDLATADEPRLRAAYAEAAGAGARHVLLDFSGTEYLNSSGVSVLIDLLRAAQEQGRRLYFTGLTPHYAKVLSFMGLAQYAPIVAVEAEAAALAGRAQRSRDAGDRPLRPPR